MRIFVSILSLFLISFNAKADFNSYQLHMGMGMINASYAQNPSSFDSTGSNTPASGSSSIMPFELALEKAWGPKRSLIANAIFPSLSPGTDSYFHLGTGINFFIKSLSSTGVFNNDQYSIKFNSTWRYYWGLESGLSYFVFTTKTEKKSDLLFEIGAHLGVGRSFKNDWAARFELGMARGLGVQTSTMITKIMFGISRPVFN